MEQAQTRWAWLEPVLGAAGLVGTNGMIPILVITLYLTLLPRQQPHYIVVGMVKSGLVKWDLVQ